MVSTTSLEAPVPLEPPASPRRWAVLGAFMATSVVAQMLWITFSSPLPSCDVAVFCPSPSNAVLFVNVMAATYPLAFVVVSLPVGYFVDSRGFRKAVLVGSGLLAVSGLLRPFSPNFVALLVFQGVGAVGQPFILNSISKMVRTWFPESEVATATGLGTLSIYIGLAIGLGATQAVDGALGVRNMLLVYGAVAALAFVLFIVFGHERKAGSSPEETPSFREVVGILRVRNIAILSALFFVGIGIFNAFASDLQWMLPARGIPSGLVNPLGGLLIFGGIFGALTMTVLADRYRTLIRPLWLSLIAATLLWAVLGVVKGTLPEALGLLVLGFFFMATLPLALDLSARSVPRSAEGAANAVVWEFSQIGGFALIFVFSDLGGAPGASTWTLTFFLASGLCAVMLVLGLLLRPP